MSRKHKKHKRHGWHKVKVHRWKSGTLEVEEIFFDSFDRASGWCKTIIADSFKIFDSLDELVYNGDCSDIDFYA